MRKRIITLSISFILVLSFVLAPLAQADSTEATVPGYSGLFAEETSTVSSLVPDFGFPGTNLQVTINGTNLGDTQTVEFSTGAITVSQLTVNETGTRLICDFTISGSAVPGPYSLSIFNDSGLIDSPLKFLVVTNAVPQINYLAVDFGYQGETIKCEVRGNNIWGTTSVNFSGDGLIVTDIEPNFNGTWLAFSVSISRDAKKGFRDMTVTNRVGPGPALIGVFEVLGRAGPTLVNVSNPGYTLSGQPFDVNIEIDTSRYIRGWGFELEYDSRVIQPASAAVKPGLVNGVVMPVDLWVNDIASNCLRVMGRVGQTTKVKGSGYLAVIQFNAVGMEGTRSLLRLNNTAIFDFRGDYLPCIPGSDVYVSIISSYSDIRGDLNNDGAVDRADIAKLRRALSKLDRQNAACDLNDDGKVDVGDLAVLLGIISGLES